MRAPARALCLAVLLAGLPACSGPGPRQASCEGELRALWQEARAEVDPPTPLGLPRASLQEAAWRPAPRAAFERVRELYRFGALETAHTRFLAARVLAQSAEPSDHELALALALAANEADLPATRRMVALAQDRVLLGQGLPQRFGTQCVRDRDGRFALYRVDPRTSDAERARWSVPPLAEARAGAARIEPALSEPQSWIEIPSW